MKKTDFAILIGRFQPFHNGHLHLVKQAMELAKFLIILCGSANRPRSITNPWTFQERQTMIRNCFSEKENNQIIILPIEDMTYDDRSWVTNVKNIVNQQIKIMNQGSANIIFVGHIKDHSSYYLKLFSEWQFIELENFQNINATNIREIIFNKKPIKELSHIVPKPIIDYIDQFTKTEEYLYICNESKYIKDYKDSWSHTPFPPIFTTVDIMLLCHDHILMIKRKHAPGKDLLALPGRFLEPQETLIDSCIRELYEETSLDLDHSHVRSSIKTMKVFDAPNRSARGRVIAHVFYADISIYTTKKLPKLKAGDDARQAFWIKTNELDSCNIYEDHYFIIQQLLNLPSL